MRKVALLARIRLVRFVRFVSAMMERNSAVPTRRILRRSEHSAPQATQQQEPLTPRSSRNWRLLVIWLPSRFGYLPTYFLPASARTRTAVADPLESGTPHVPAHPSYHRRRRPFAARQR